MGPLRYLGLMSGTSLDGVDVALVQVEEGDRLGARLEAFLSLPYDREQRQAIRAALTGGPGELCRLNFELGRWFAQAARRLLDETGLGPGDITAIGSHGQTIWHEPPRRDRVGSTLQLGEPAVIAENLGVRVISDFRSRDVAAGGQGAPLVPAVERLLFSLPNDWRALQNIGGIANLTLLPPEDVDSEVIAFDTGPGVAVIDAVVEIVSEGAERFDLDGRRAAGGTPNEELLIELLRDPYFSEPPPKSTGRERYGDAYARQLVERARDLGLTGTDTIATATALTARTIAAGYRLGAGVRAAECVVSGGGARNQTLMRMLADELHPVPVTDLSALGWDPDAKEAAAFAILAHLFLHGRPGNLPAATGAAGPRVLGKLTPP